jgi:hypothetical protein
MHFGGNEWQEEVDRIRPCLTKWKSLKSEAKENLAIAIFLLMDFIASL